MNAERYTVEIVVPATRFDVGAKALFRGVVFRVADCCGRDKGTWRRMPNGQTETRLSKPPWYVLECLEVTEAALKCYQDDDGKEFLDGMTCAVGIFDAEAEAITDEPKTE